jgi:hypothetical protein
MPPSSAVGAGARCNAGAAARRRQRGRGGASRAGGEPAQHHPQPRCHRRAAAQVGPGWPQAADRVPRQDQVGGHHHRDGGGGAQRLRQHPDPRPAAVRDRQTQGGADRRLSAGRACTAGRAVGGMRGQARPRRVHRSVSPPHHDRGRAPPAARIGGRPVQRLRSAEQGRLLHRGRAGPVSQRLPPHLHGRRGHHPQDAQDRRFAHLAAALHAQCLAGPRSAGRARVRQLAASARAVSGRFRAPGVRHDDQRHRPAIRCWSAT